MMIRKKAAETLEDFNLYRRDQNVPNAHEMPNPKAIGKAIDIAVRTLQEGLPPSVQISMIFAARYAHHRQTVGAHTVCMSLNKVWDQLSSNIQTQIIKESHEATYNLDDWETFRKNHG